MYAFYARHFRHEKFHSIAAVAALLLLAGCGEHQDQGQAARRPPQVGVLTVHTQSVLRTTELPGRTTAVQTSDVRPQVSGVVLKRLFTEGSEVHEGQQLYQIDPATYQATYESALATLNHSEAAFATAAAKAARYRRLSEAKAISAQDHDDALATEKEAVADIGTARASLEQARINLKYTKVLAPISGHIGRSTVTPGALVIADQTTVMATVTQLDPIYVDLSQSSATLLRLRREIKSGEIATVSDGSAKVMLKLEDGSTYPLPGKLQFTEVTVDQGTGTVLLRALFPNPQHLLLPGMFVHAQLQEGVNRNGILIPQTAVSRDVRGQATVFVVDASNKAQLRVVTADTAIGDQWVITAGLRPGERVIVDGLQSVRPGIPVTPVPAQRSAANR